MAVAALEALNRPLRRADLEYTPDDGRRYELIDGQLYVSAAPGYRHQSAVGNLYAILRAAAPGSCLVLVGPFAVALGEDTEIQPDIVVGLRKDFAEREILTPKLSVEVLSPSTRRIDLILKRHRLERAGIPSYWIVDPVARPDEASLLAYEIGPDGTYRQAAHVVGDEPLHAEQPFPVTVVPADLVR